jgi:hypothetical protein
VLDTTLKSLSKTAIANEAMLWDKIYQTPIEKQLDLIKMHEAEWNEDLEKWETYAAEVRNEFPTASKEKVDGIVFKRMWNERNIWKEAWDPELTLKPDMQKTLKTIK